VEDRLLSDAADFEKFGDVVPEGYEYYEKMITPGKDLRLPNAYLKWYNLYPLDNIITEEQDAETRTFIEGEVEEGRLKLNDELGFVILHRAGSVLLLLLTTWRNTNEMWESVWVKSAIHPDSYRQVTFEESHRATYCVWELGAVWHERDAWVRFLSSRRDVEAKQEYLKSKFSGRV
jgi:hypothetical protein